MFQKQVVFAALNADPEMGVMRHVSSTHNMRPRNILVIGPNEIELGVHRYAHVAKWRVRWVCILQIILSFVIIFFSQCCSMLIICNYNQIAGKKVLRKLEQLVQFRCWQLHKLARTESADFAAIFELTALGICCICDCRLFILICVKL